MEDSSDESDLSDKENDNSVIFDVENGVNMTEEIVTRGSGSKVSDSV